jgi:hypothetical protein
MIADAAFRLVAHDVGKHGGIADARYRHAPDARVGIILRKCAQRLGVAWIELVNRFDANVGIRVRGFRLGAELVENSHWVVQTPAAVWRRPVPPCVRSVGSPSVWKG